jgi:hypothetical protein
MIFVGIWAGILSFLAFWVVLFTGKYPQGWFDFMVKFYNWIIRYDSSIFNLVDGYPAIGINGTSDKVSLDVSYPDKINQGLVILRVLLGLFYVLIPHGFCLLFRVIWGGILGLISWFSVLFTGNYPEGFHKYQVGTFRWVVRIYLYMGFMSDEYPPFTGE